MSPNRLVVLLVIVGMMVPFPSRAGNGTTEGKVEDDLGEPVREGTRVRVDPASGDRFAARYLLRAADSLRVAPTTGIARVHPGAHSIM